MTRSTRGAGIAGALLAAALTLNGGPRPRGGGPAPQGGCEALGPGFIKLEGTDTCIRLGGSVRVEGSYATGGARR